MKNPLTSPASASLGLLLARLPIGVTFVVAGVMKFKGGVGDFVAKSLSLAPSYLPQPAAKAYLYSLPAVELLIGLLLIVGWFTRITGFIAALVLISIMMALPGFWQGDSWAPSSNAVLLSMALLLFFTGPGGFAVDRLKFGRSPRPKPTE